MRIRRRKRGKCAALAMVAMLAAGHARAVAEQPVRAAAPAEAPASRPWLGVLLGDAVDGGVQVVAVVPGGPAAAADLRAGDVVLRLGEHPIARNEDLAGALAGAPPGDPLVVQVVRDGVLVRKTVRPAARRPPGPVIAPPAPLPPPRVLLPSPGTDLDAMLGLRTSAIPAELRRHYGAPAEAGLLVIRIAPGTVASRSGIEVGDVLVRACGEALDQPAANPCGPRPEGPHEIALELVRDGEPRVLKVELPGGYAAPSAPDARVAGQTGAIDERARELRIRVLEREIARLEQRLAALKRELESLE